MITASRGMGSPGSVSGSVRLPGTGTAAVPENAVSPGLRVAPVVFNATDAEWAVVMLCWDAVGTMVIANSVYMHVHMLRGL